MAAQKGKGALPATSHETLGAYLEEWLRLKEGTIRPVTWASYRDTIKKHLSPGLGALKVQKVSVAAIQAYIADKRREGLSPKTIRYHVCLLGTALRNAVPDTIPFNPVEDRRVRAALPKKEQHEIDPLDEEDVPLLLAKARSLRERTLYRLAIDSGMRMGELLGLRWEDVDLGRLRISIRQSLSRVGGLG